MKKLLTVILALTLCIGLAACGDDTVESVTKDVYAEQGGSIEFPEGMDTTKKFSTFIDGGTLYASFNGVQTRNTGYFQTSGDTITMTARATTESTGLLEYKLGLWELTEDNHARYVDGCTLYFTTGGDCYTGTFSGLNPGTHYKLTLSYDSGLYKITGAFKVEGLSNGESVTDEDEDAAA